MSLKTTIEAAIKQAMLARDQPRLMALRGIKSAILLAETEKGAAEELSPEAELKLLNKAAKQRRESAQIYQEQFRSELEAKELAELAVIEEFLPAQLDEATLMGRVAEIVQRLGAAGPSDLGKVMGVAAKELSGQADGRAISQAVSALLNNTDF